MSASASPNPTNLILLAVIGIGAYWFMSRRAVAAQPVIIQQKPSKSAQNAAIAGQLLNTGINALGSIFGGGGQSNPITWDGMTNDGPQIRDDGYVFNNPTQSAWDWWATNGTAGD